MLHVLQLYRQTNLIGFIVFIHVYITTIRRPTKYPILNFEERLQF